MRGKWDQKPKNYLTKFAANIPKTNTYWKIKKDDHLKRILAVKLMLAEKN